MASFDTHIVGVFTTNGFESLVNIWKINFVTEIVTINLD